MKTNELRRIAEENDYVMTDLIAGLRFTKKDNENHITIGSKFENTIWISIQDWCFEEDFKMVKAAIEFAETPIEDREEEKKFYLRHRWLESIGNRYLITDLGDGYYYLDDKDDYFAGKMQFTLEEIEEIKEKLDTDLNDFELVEAKE